MAKLFSDGFDSYATVAEAAQGHWDASANWSISTGRFTGSQSLLITSSVSTALNYLSKANSSNDTIVFLNFAFIQTASLALSATNGSAWVLSDGANAQVSIFMQSNGSIVVRAGGTTASIIATYANAFAQNVWAHFQCKITINNTTGRVQIRKDGATSDSFDSGASLNTRNGSANSYVNKIDLINGGSNSIGGAQKYDDFYHFSGTGAAPNDWVGDIKCKCAYPSADTAQKDFAVGAPTTTTFGTTIGSSTGANSANVAYYSGPHTPSYSGTIASLVTSFQVVPTAGSKHKMALYSDSSGSPGSIIAATNEIISPTGGTNTFTFASPPSVTDGTAYWFGYIADTSNSPANSNTTAKQQATAYSGGFPATASPTTSANSLPMVANLTITANYSTLNETQEDGDTSYVGSATVTNRDLYSITYTDIPGTIIDVTQRAFMKKSSSGTRNGQLVQKAGGGSHTVTLGTDTVESSSYTWHKIDGPLNPDTGLAWTPSEVAALQIGQQVSA